MSHESFIDIFDIIPTKMLIIMVISMAAVELISLIFKNFWFASIGHRYLLENTSKSNEGQRGNWKQTKISLEMLNFQFKVKCVY
jgi:hypothetical protein